MTPAAEILREHGIDYVETRKGKYTTKCPRCGGGYLNVEMKRDGVVWYCNGCQEGDGERYNDEQQTTSGQLGPIKAVYDYTDENGDLLFQALRFEPLNAPKEFRQRTNPDQKPWSIKGVRIVPFRLPELLEDLAHERVIFVVEGEKDVNTLREMGIPATCNPMGAGKWWADFNPLFKDAHVVICGDNDAPGRDHVRKVAQNFYGFAADLRVLDLKEHWPEIEESDDISDWFEARHTVDELWRIVDTLPDWKPAETNGFDEQPPSIDWIEDRAPTGNWQDTRPAQQKEDELEIWDAGDDPGFIPPREWLLGNQFCKRFISSLVAAGGTGKTALRMLQYIAMATCRALTGQHVFVRSRVLLICLEDDRTEIDRRIKAVLDYHKIDRREIKGWLFVTCPKRSKLAETKNKVRVQGSLARQIRIAIEKLKPDVVAFDPFRKAHALEENNSGDMDFVCDLLAEMAVEFNIAPDIPHHVHKGQIEPGDADAGRGSSSVKDAGRLTYTLTYMSAEDAKLYGIPVEMRRDYIRVDSAKVNIVRNSTAPTWFKLVSVSLGNATDRYPNGDSVQTVEPWKPPETWEDTSNEEANFILDLIARGNAKGQRYSNAPKASNERAAWRVVQQVWPKKADGQCREIIRQWLENELLYVDDYHDPVRREDLKGLFVDDAKRPGRPPRRASDAPQDDPK
jgi:hypothetical protein